MLASELLSNSMKSNIQLNCHLPTFDEKSLQRLAQKFAKTDADRRALMRLLRDQDELLDLIDRADWQSYITAEREHLDDALCCYCIVRKQLMASGICSRKTAIYLSNIWCNYRESGLLPQSKREHSPFIETMEILRELNFVKGYEKFELLAMSGNYYLFLMAFFEGYFREIEAQKNVPMAYYSAFARIAYRAASDHGLSEEFALTEVYENLADKFEVIKDALSSAKLEQYAQAGNP